MPVVSNSAGNPIDAFVDAARLEQGLPARPPADKAIVLRRVYLDLIGLPPTPAEADAFEDDDSPDAYERVVDRLLASPQYGERWGRHWMDVWRYSDWAGFGAEVRESQPHIWRWRDWIIESLNADKDYDRMVREMLAGDELAPADPATLRATGFLVRQYYVFNRNVVLDNAVEHTAKAFLGVTLNCARCHDHKYDPINQREYYSFKAFFEPVQFRTDRVPGEPDTKKAGLVHAYDGAKVEPTHLLIRGDEKEPDPQQLCRRPCRVVSAGPVSISKLLPCHERRPSRTGGRLSFRRNWPPARRRLQVANVAFQAAKADAAAKLDALTAEAELTALQATLQAEQCQDEGLADHPEGRHCAELAVAAQRLLAEVKARRDLARAETALQKADAKAKSKAEASVKAARDVSAKAEAAAAAPLDAKFAAESVGDLSVHQHRSAAGAGPLDHRPVQPAGRPGCGQSRLGSAFRPAAGADGLRLRPQRPAADAPGLARLAGRRVHGPRLEHEVPSPPDRHVGHIPARFPAGTGLHRTAIPTTAISGV